MQKIEIIPSLLSADFTNLSDEINKVERCGCTRLHIDVMDGCFVPNITIGPVVIKSLRRVTKLFLQTHLMIEEPARFIQDFKDAGADCIIIHKESCSNFLATIESIKGLGLQVGIALHPETPVDSIRDVIQKVDMILVMSVNPGFAGQEFIRGSQNRVKEVKCLLDKKGSNIPIGVDGGMNSYVASLVVQAGARYLIAGDALFKCDDIEKNITDIYNSIKRR
jgi:ribulose-phosphate 3-epimerase